MAGVGVGSTDNIAIEGLRSNHRGTVEGVVTGTTAGVYLGDNSAEDHHQRLTVGQAGKVFGYSTYGASVIGYSSRIVNDGTIFGGAYGMRSTGTLPDGIIAISQPTNSGTIEGSSFGIYRFGGEVFVVNNTGTIE